MTRGSDSGSTAGWARQWSWHASFDNRQSIIHASSGPVGGKTYPVMADGITTDACCSDARFNVYPQTHYSLWKWLKKLLYAGGGDASPSSPLCIRPWLITLCQKKLVIRFNFKASKLHFQYYAQYAGIIDEGGINPLMPTVAT